MNNKATGTLFTLLLLLTLTAETGAIGEVQENVWVIGPRTLPVPVDVCDLMRESLLNTPKPDVETAKNLAPQTREQWETLIVERETNRAAKAQALAVLNNAGVSRWVGRRRVPTTQTETTCEEADDESQKRRIQAYLAKRYHACKPF